MKINLDEDKNRIRKLRKKIHRTIYGVGLKALFLQKVTKNGKDKKFR
jgi:hypothetical protein